MKELTWWQKPVRMMRVDYAPDFSAVRDMDLHELARNRRDDWGINCEWIVGSPGFSRNSHTTTFKADGYETYPGFEGFDYLRSYTPIAHEYEIRVVVYLNLHWYEYAFAAQHPGWEQIMPDGKAYGKVWPLYGDGTTMCVNTPWREWSFNLIREAAKTGVDGVFLDGPVVFPPCCYCPTCREQFKAKYGQDIPTEDWSNPLWKDFLDFREDSIARYLEDARKALHEINPEAILFPNVGSWSPQCWKMARDMQTLAPFQDFGLAESFFHYVKETNIWDALMTGKYLRAGKKPSIVATHYMNGAWHYLLLPPEELKLGFVQAAAANSNPWIALMELSIESCPEASKPVKEIFNFLASTEDYYTDTRSIADVALFFSANTSRNYLSRFDDIYRTYSGKEEDLTVDTQGVSVTELSLRKTHCEKMMGSAYRGYFHSLTRGHFLFDIVVDQDLCAEGLSKYKTLVLPDAACLSTEAASSVREFVLNGGNLIASFDAGFYDERGNYTEELFDLLGIESVEGAFPATWGENYSQTVTEHLGFQKGYLLERGASALKVKAKNDASVPELFMKPLSGVYVPLKGVSTYPSLVMSNYGNGKVAYFAEAMGGLLEVGMVSTERRVCGIVDQFTGSASVKLDAPSVVSIDVYKQNTSHRIIVHLTNSAVDRRPVTEFIPVRDIRIGITLDVRPSRVFALRENSDLGVDFSVGCLSIRVPELKTYDVIVVEI